MKSINILLGAILLSLCLNHHLAAQSPSLKKAIDSKKLDAGAQALLQSLGQDRLNKIADINHDPNFKSLNKQFALEVSEQNEILVSLFVQTHGDHHAFSEIHNAQVTGIYGDILSVKIPVSQIGELAVSHSIQRIEASTKVQLLNDRANRDTKVRNVHRGEELPKAFKGDSVIIGIVDSGIDFTHPDFSDADGNSRILFIREGDDIWDLDDITNNPETITQKDDDGHGTHVTGTAAGFSSRYSGVAPNAFIIASKTNFFFDDVVAGVDFIFKKADSLGLPAVVNLSLGLNNGPHNGTTLAEAALSSLVGTGKIIISSAGNDGNTTLHLNYEASEDTTITRFVPNNEKSTIDSYFSADDNVKFGLMVEKDNQKYFTQAHGKEVDFGTDYIVSGSDTLASLDIWFAPTASNEIQAIMEISYKKSQDTYLYTTGQGEFHAWAFRNDYFSPQNFGKNLFGGDSEYTVGTPATAEKIIAVGSYMTRKLWTDRDGNNWQMNSDNVGNISSFSSIGPSRDGRVLPHVSAPGQLLVSSLSADVPINSSNAAYIMEGDEYIALQGTSMAAPHVSGIIALMLQAYPELTYSQALAILKSTAREDNFTGSDLPNNKAGAGKVDALAAVQAAVALNPTSNEHNQEPLSFILHGNYPNPFNPTTNIKFELDRSATISLTIFDVLGRKVNQLISGQRMNAGSHEITFDAQNLSSGIYLIQLQNGEQLLTHKMMLLK